jgi:hypothetical protein
MTALVDHNTLRELLHSAESEQICAVAIDDLWAGSSSWREAAQQYHRDRAGRVLSVVTEPERLAQLRKLMGDNISLDRAWHELNDIRNWPTPAATLNALWWAICERGMNALAEPPISDRIASFDEAARFELDRRIATMEVGVGK